MEQQQLISTFLDITVDQTFESAVRFLKATNWNLQDAVNLFLLARRNPNHAHKLQIPFHLPSTNDIPYHSSEKIWYSTSEQYHIDDQDMTLTEHNEETCFSSDQFELPVLTEEPKGDCDRNLICSLCVRFPDGRRKERKFLKNEPIQLLWSFCYSLMEESEKKKKTFKLVLAIPGATKTLEYGTNATFDQYEIDNSIISLTWD